MITTRIATTARAIALPVAIVMTSIVGNPAYAQDGWNVFEERGGKTRGQQNSTRNQVQSDQYFSPSDPAQRTRNRTGVGGAVERTDLAPVMARDGSGLPYELWRGLDTSAFERLLGQLDIPPRSPALYALWRRLITSDVEAPSGTGTSQFEALRAEALFRSGLLTQIGEILGRQTDARTDPLVGLMRARADVGLGRKQEGCDAARQFAGRASELPESLRITAILITGYCAAADDNKPGAGLAAQLAREMGAENSLALAALDSLAYATPLKISADTPIGLIDYRILALGQPPAPDRILKTARPALLAALALDRTTPNDIRLLAAEAAAKTNTISTDNLRRVYHDTSTSQPAKQLLRAPPQGNKVADATRRGALLRAAEAERTPFRKVRLIRAFLDSARSAKLYFPALKLANTAAADLVQVPEIGWFAETGIETSLAAGDIDRANAWVELSARVDRRGEGGLKHWRALIDIADPQAAPATRRANLAGVEKLAVTGRIAPELLHRLATVLDALHYDIPIPLWEAASRSPQPSGGHLPETGVLSQLQSAAKNREFGHTVLLAMKTLGPNGAQGAHMIALGDSIRALRRAGLEPDARRLGLETLFAGWPRGLSN